MTDSKARTRREKIAAKIRALMAKTVENGCTEGEAVSAAAMAAQMLAEHDLTVEEVNLREDGFARAERPVEDVVDMHLWKVGNAVGALCGVRSWSTGSGRGKTAHVFFGLATDVEVAGYVLAIAERAMRGEWGRFEAGNALLRQSVRRRKSLSFVDGMADRLAEKIREITWTRNRERGRGLVPAKDAIVLAEMNERGIALSSSRDRYAQSGMDGYEDGRTAVEGVRFDASVSAPKPPAAAIARG